MYRLSLVRKAQKFYEKADTSLARRLNQCFDQLRQDPYGSTNIKLLHGTFEGCFRYRVGDWRVVYRINEGPGGEPDDETEGIITVLLIAHRREVYRDR